MTIKKAQLFNVFRIVAHAHIFSNNGNGLVTCVNVGECGSDEEGTMPGSIQQLDPALMSTSSTVRELTRLVNISHQSTHPQYVSTTHHNIHSASDQSL